MNVIIPVLLFYKSSFYFFCCILSALWQAQFCNLLFKSVGGTLKSSILLLSVTSLASFSFSLTYNRYIKRNWNETSFFFKIVRFLCRETHMFHTNCFFLFYGSFSEISLLLEALGSGIEIKEHTPMHRRV